MPRLTYTPEGADPKVWDFAFGRIKFGERAAIEKLTGLGWDEVQRDFWDNHGEVIHAFLWILLKRDIPTLRAAEVDFVDDEIDLDVTDDEARAVVDGFRKQDVITDEEAEAIAAFETRLAAQADEPAPKEGAVKSKGSTTGTSSDS